MTVCAADNKMVDKGGNHLSKSRKIPLRILGYDDSIPDSLLDKFFGSFLFKTDGPISDDEQFKRYGCAMVILFIMYAHSTFNANSESFF